MKDVLVFHYLPILWYRHPIPNNLREFWYYQRPEILEYMQNAYKDLNIQFFPNGIIQQLTQKTDLISQIHINNGDQYFSTELLANQNLLSSLDFIYCSIQNIYTSL